MKTIHYLCFFLKACYSGKFGDDCNRTCGRCLQGNDCHNINGTCLSGCEPGYNGQLCDTRMYIADRHLCCNV